MIKNKIDNPAKTVALALARDICQDCVCCEWKDGIPCLFFQPNNFYYDSNLKHFWCHNWMGEEQTKPI
jgi:hypothetical protein